jgi:hypothetical protein
VSLRVYDILGREVATLVSENRKPGQYTERFDGSRMASGVYMYVLRSSEGQLTSRMILLEMSAKAKLTLFWSGEPLMALSLHLIREIYQQETGNTASTKLSYQDYLRRLPGAEPKMR